MGRLVLDNVSKLFGNAARGNSLTAVDRFSLDVAEGRLLVLLGPSGCGKTTVLRLIAGLDQPSSGRILLDSQVIDEIPPQKRSVGMAFQYPALLPQLSVRENIALGPKLGGVSATDTQARVGKLAALLTLTDLLDRAPETLSGGQQQRVSLARALAKQPSVLLLDEPLANLDPVSRVELREAIRSVQQELQVTTIYVTHDQSEAAAISDEIAVMNRGGLVQRGSASDIYRTPANLFVAGFFDHDRPNIFPAELRDGRLHLEGANGSFAISRAGNRLVTCVLRTISIHPDGPLRGNIQRVQHTGWSTRVVFDFGGLCLRAEIPHPTDLRVGQSFSFDVNAADFLLFDHESGRLIRD